LLVLLLDLQLNCYPIFHSCRIIKIQRSILAAPSLRPSCVLKVPCISDVCPKVFPC
jgi:hypothetical protein